MIAKWHEIDITPDGLVKKAGLPTGRHTYSFKELITCGKSVGLNFIHVEDVTWEMLKSENDKGLPTIPLLRYGDIPNNLDDFTGAHFWVNCGYTDSTVIVNDPNWWTPRRQEGDHRSIPIAAFIKSIGESLKLSNNKPFQALFLR